MSNHPDDRTHSELDAEPAISPEITGPRDVIYAWQMLTEDGQWNIIAMAAVPGVPPMPLVTSRFDVAWEAFEVAQAHANRYQCEARLAVFKFDGVTAIVLPEGADG